MHIALIDADSHHFPNLALMRISAYHKQRGDTVEWWFGDMIHYDIVYISRVFSDTYSDDVQMPVNADEIITGGTGFAIRTIDGVETYDKSKDPELPSGIECQIPDYSIYPMYDYAVSMTSRGCPRGCPWCHVSAKEGRKSVKTGNVSDFWTGQKLIKVLDPNICACADKEDILRQYRDTNAYIDFSQGLDIRLLTDTDIEIINGMKLKQLHFAWDDPKQDLTKYFDMFKRKFRRNTHLGTVYILTAFNSTEDEDLWRIYTLRDMGFDPYVMIYNKPAAPESTRRMQRWCNDKAVFKTVGDFSDYMANV